MTDNDRDHDMMEYMTKYMNAKIASTTIEENGKQLEKTLDDAINASRKAITLVVNPMMDIEFSKDEDDDEDGSNSNKDQNQEIKTKEILASHQYNLLLSCMAMNLEHAIDMGLKYGFKKENIDKTIHDAKVKADLINEHLFHEVELAMRIDQARQTNDLKAVKVLTDELEELQKQEKNRKEDRVAEKFFFQLMTKFLLDKDKWEGNGKKQKSNGGKEDQDDDHTKEKEQRK